MKLKTNFNCVLKNPIKMHKLKQNVGLIRLNFLEINAKKNYNLKKWLIMI
jgi:hypothetical protein